MMLALDFTTAGGPPWAAGGRPERQNSVMGMTSHLRITGRVQGVGFRDALLREALARGLAGWVRNRRDGSVEAVLQWAQRGPPAARVDHVEALPAQGEFNRPYAGFEWLPTV